jgi:hypothetical protein
VGFGLCLDEDMGKTGDFPLDAQSVREKFPAKQTAVNAALGYTDEYVWVWHGKRNGWEDGLPFAEALRAGRERPGKVVVRQLPADDPRVLLAVKAEKQDIDDCAVAAAVAGGAGVWMKLPVDGWDFRVDPDDRGLKEKWYATAMDQPLGSKIRIDQFWEQQGWDYDGAAWYRRSVNLPTPPAGKKLLLAIGAADEAATVWINGVPVGGQDIGEAGWDRSFVLDTAGNLHPGKNEIVIRVFDRTAAGGLWRPLQILATN